MWSLCTLVSGRASSRKCQVRARGGPTENLPRWEGRSEGTPHPRTDGLDPAVVPKRPWAEAAGSGRLCSHHGAWVPHREARLQPEDAKSAQLWRM